MMINSCGSDDDVKNPCEGIVCLNDGYCANGSCVCPDGYTGSNCSQQITPSVIRIHKIEVTRFPPTKPNGGGWDTNGTAPDIYPVIYLGETLIWSSDAMFQNAVHTETYAFTPNPIISLASVGSQYSIVLYDYDDFSSDEFMGGINFVPYQSNNNFPEVIILDVAGGTVAFKLYASYAW